MTSNDYSIWVYIGGIVIAGGAGFLARWAWTETQNKIAETRNQIGDATAFIGKSVDKLWESMKTKANNSELIRARDAQIQLGEKFDAHAQEDRERFEKIISGVARLEGKMDSLLIRKRNGE